ncbi:multicopper oxidase family protein [Tahibacter amnicola]|uniref:Copper oxidase n=1 Tax=Tahibacter amnicola TaxID=2976241 RepID=A0ABY6B940_9GAMM|nr:copper oxidase [Tahibacter amnicola]UXI66046.1 copper oxidase [Tahibacter amnicola]
MKMTRRHWVQLMGAGAIAPLGVGAARALAQDHSKHAMPAEPPARPSKEGHDGRYTPVRTLNGWTLPYRMVDGVKEYHLVAEEVVHEFAPGCVAKCWGYNGTTPGPTIEAVEGDRLRIYVTNRLPEHTNIHWHGILLPSGMDGVGGVTQRNIQPGETYAYEFTLKQSGTHKYHPHADEMVQMAMGMMGMLIIHPKDGEPERIDRDYAVLLHNWALHPGTYRPDPSVMQDFDLWTFNSKVFPAIEPMVAATGDRVRVRVANLSMWNHPIHMHGVQFLVTGSDGGRWPKSLWRPEVTEIVGVGQTRDMEFVAVPGDWAFHCHMSHHTMNAMGHEIPNTMGVDQKGVEEEIRKILPGYMAMGKDGMAEHQDHTDSGHMRGPENTLPMMMGKGPFGNIEMGGMFTLIKVRDGLPADDYRDPGWFNHPPGTQPKRVSSDPNFGNPVRRGLPADASPKFETKPVDHSKMKHS